MRWQRCIGAMIGLGVCVSGAWWTCFAQESGPDLSAILMSKNVVLSEKDAYLVLPPRVVATGITDRVYISSTGDRLLIAQHSEPPLRSSSLSPVGRIERSLVLWNARTQRASTLWRTVEGDTASTKIEEMAWIPRNDTALGVLRTTADPNAPEPTELPGKLVLVNSANSTLRTVSVVAPGERLLVSEFTPIALLYSAKNRMLKPVTPDGRVQASIPIAGTNELPADPAWYEDGKTINAYHIGIRNGKQVMLSSLIDIATGKITENTKRGVPEAVEKWKLPPLEVSAGTGSITGDTQTISLHPLWMMGKTADLTGQALITADGEYPVLLPGAVLYQAQGTLYSRQILTIDKATYLAERQRAFQRQTMQNGKMVALAMMMYCQDYDENFPQPDSNIRDLILPYLKNANVFNNPETGQFAVTFAYKNPALSSVSSPDTTILGYISGPNGRAVMYVDGHVKWENSP